MAVKHKIPVTVWYLEYKAGGSDKFYQVFVSESGDCVLRWGRRGAAGQSSVTRYSGYDDARDQGLKQVFAKKAKGYQQVYGDMKFMVTSDTLDYTRMASDAAALVRDLAVAREDGDFGGAKEAVLKHYADFAEQAKSLIDRAGSQDFEQVHGEYEALKAVWEEIDDRHAEVTAAMGLAEATLAQSLMGWAGPQQ